MIRQILQGQHVCQRNRQYLDVVGLLLGFDNFFQGQSQPEFAQLQFDLHFPETDHAEHQNVLPILTQCQRLLRKSGGFAVPPDERGRVQ